MGRFRIRFPEFRPESPDSGAQSYLLERFQDRLHVGTLPRTLLVEIQDNGRGLLAHAGNGNGLRNMLARMESVGGTFDYRSSPGCGTTLIFSLKLPSHGI